MAPPSCKLLIWDIVVMVSFSQTLNVLLHDFIIGRDRWSFSRMTSWARGVSPRLLFFLIGFCFSLGRFIRVPWHVLNRPPVNPPEVKPPGSSWPPKRPGRVRPPPAESRSPTDTGEKHSTRVVKQRNDDKQASYLLRWIIVYQHYVISCIHWRFYFIMYVLKVI